MSTQNGRANGHYTNGVGHAVHQENNWDGYDTNPNWELDRYGPGAHEPIEPSAPAVDPSKGLKFACDTKASTTTNYMVKGLIEPGITGAVYGPWGGAKTFFMLKLSYDLIHGKRLFGQRTRPAPVLYCAYEGFAGLDRRVDAAELNYGTAGNMFARLVLPEPPPLDKSEAGQKGVEAIVIHAKQLMEVNAAHTCLIVIDTLSKATVGNDEQSNGDMNAFLRDRAEKIARTLNAAVVFVHHSGKDASKGARGGSALIGGVELSIRLDRLDPDAPERTVFFEKVKDGAAGMTFGFRLRNVSVGVDDEGDNMPTCIVVWDEPGAGKAALKPDAPLPAQAKKAFEQLLRLFNGKSKVVQVPAAELDLTGSPLGYVVPVVRKTDWQAKCRAANLTISGDAKAEGVAFARAMDKLSSAYKIGCFGEWVWLIPKATPLADYHDTVATVEMLPALQEQPGEAT